MPKPLPMRFLPFLLALALGLLLAHPSRAQDTSSLVGSWYGELAVPEAKGGNPVNLRKWLRINRPDGTQTITFRFYLDGRLQWEQVWVGTWAYRDGVYSTQCQSLSAGGRSRPCSDRRTYGVDRIDAKEMVYTNRATGERFTVKRVPDDYRLP